MLNLKPYTFYYLDDPDTKYTILANIQFRKVDSNTLQLEEKEVGVFKTAIIQMRTQKKIEIEKQKDCIVIFSNDRYRVDGLLLTQICICIFLKSPITMGITKKIIKNVIMHTLGIYRRKQP